MSWSQSLAPAAHVFKAGVTHILAPLTHATTGFANSLDIDLSSIASEASDILASDYLKSLIAPVMILPTIIAHESGHYAAARFFKYPARFSFRRVVWEDKDATPWQRLVVHAAGPAANLAMAALHAGLSFFSDNGALDLINFIGVATHATMFIHNSLPVTPGSFLAKCLFIGNVETDGYKVGRELRILRVR